jgi:hypothetical protein
MVHVHTFWERIVAKQNNGVKTHDNADLCGYYDILLGISMRYITLYNQHMVNLAQRRPNKTHQAEKSGQWGCGLSATETGSMFLHIIGELICNRSTCGRDVENANPWGRWYQLNVRMYNPD